MYLLVLISKVDDVIFSQSVRFLVKPTNTINVQRKRVLMLMSRSNDAY